MKAVVITAYGSPDVLKFQEVETPIPKDNEVLVKIHATSVNFGDTFVRNFKTVTPAKFTMPTPLWLPTRLAFGIRKPNVKILGSEFSGVVESVGRDVVNFKPGDAVFGYSGQSMGTNAEYVTISADGLIAPKPDNMTHEEATTVPYGALTALSVLKKANIQPGQKVLINGASGSIGAYAMQLAKYYGAEVTGVAGTPRLEMLKALGADKVIDYTKEDFTQNGETYDLIVDIKRKTSFSKVKQSLNEGGIYLLTSFKTRNVLQMLWTSRFESKRVICALSMEKPEDLAHIKALVESGHIKTVIDRAYPLSQTADAHWYIESGKKTGNVVITIADASEAQTNIEDIRQPVSV